MAPATRWMRQTAVLWLPTGALDEEGRRVVGPAAQIRCRWEDRKGEFTDAQGETVGYDSVAAVAQEVPVGAVMRLGTLAQWEAEEGDSPSGLSEVIDSRWALDVKGRATRRELRLARYTDAVVEAS
jgi:hypothetical protein